MGHGGGANLTTLEQQDGHLSQVEVDKVFGLVGDVATKVAANDAMPCWVVLLVKFLFDICCNILFYVELLDGLGGTVHCILLHFL